MNESQITRELILDTIQEAIEPLDYVYAMWEGGAASWNRLDEWSDIDLQIDADKDKVPQVFEILEKALEEKVSPIDLKFSLPEPAWHGHHQTFYRLEKASPYLFLDLVIMDHGNDKIRLNEIEIHGETTAIFDKANVVKGVHIDMDEWNQNLQKKLETQKVLFDLFLPLTTKEIHRGNAIEAIAYYQGTSLKRLLMALRMKYSPTRYDFEYRYVYYEFPEDVVKRLESFYFIPDMETLAQKHTEATEWFWEVVADLEDGWGKG